jgi:magnesium-protoporphyrin IX monomethyl ester (oxidative) cyclase
MRLLLVHPSALMYSEIFLRLEPLGLERVAGAAREAGHEVRVVDRQVLGERVLRDEVRSFRPEALGISLNYLANIPEAIELAVKVKREVPDCFVFFGGHSVSFVAEDVLEQSAGAVDAVVRGEGEPVIAPLLEAVRDGGADGVPGIVTAAGRGPAPLMMHGIDSPLPARDLMRNRRRYFIGELDPCASIEFTRGCPWDCSFCSAWTFYGRSYRKASPEAAAEDLARIREPNVFIVDDVAFIRPEHGNAIADEVERRGSASSTTWRRAVTCCCATPRSSSGGRGSACATCSWAWRPSTPRGWTCSASGSARTRTSVRWRRPGGWASRSRSTSSWTRRGTRNGSGWCGSSRCRCRRSCTSR